MQREAPVEGECGVSGGEGAGHGFGGEALRTAVKTVLAFLEAHTYEYKKK